MNEKDDLLESRKKNFVTEIDGIYHDKNNVDEFVLKVTKNGWQYDCIFLLPDEARQIIKVLNEYLETKNE